MRLTNAIKNQIIERVMDDTFKPKRADQHFVESLLGDAIYQEHYAAYLHRMEQLPAEFFYSSSRIEANDNSKGNPRYTLPMTQSRVFAAVDARNGNYTPILIVKDPDLLARLAVCRGAAKALSVEYDSLRQELQKLLAGVTALKKLKEVWPEGAKWFPTEAALENPPMVLAHSLNQMLERIQGEVKSNA